MWKGWKQFYNRSGLATKIRLSYLILLVPVSLILFYSLFNLWYSNQRYEDMINSTLVASEFSLDFKKDFDYEIYLLIVGNKSVDESKTGEMLAKANGIVDGLEDITESKNNQKGAERELKRSRKKEPKGSWIYCGDWKKIQR